MLEVREHESELLLCKYEFIIELTRRTTGSYTRLEMIRSME